MSQPAWTDLESKGFVVVPGFLNPDLVSLLLADFHKGAPPEEYPFGFKLLGRRALQAVQAHLQPVLDQIRLATSLTIDGVNFLTFSHYVTTRLSQRTATLHQDFDLDYKLTGDHLNYLNFWVPLLKPEAERSNLCIIPFDALQARSPQAYQRLYGGGGMRLVSQSGRTAVYGHDSAPLDWIEFDVEELAVTPPTRAGDLVLLRGDVAHRTQDAETQRVAASIRVTSSSKTITRQRASQADDLPGTAQIRLLLEQCFEKLGRSQVSVGEFVEFAQGRH